MIVIHIIIIFYQKLRLKANPYNESMNYLGIDYGVAKIGVAKAEGSLAEPLMTLPTKSAISAIRELLLTYAITEIVIGDCPEEFKNQLQSLGLAVHSTDETLSSHDAREALLHKSQTKRHQDEHAVAAAIILQSWLDNSTSPLPSP